ncbi:MAG TPA: hypothetical protein VGD43_19045 [Micromonospora sp.]
MLLAGAVTDSEAFAGSAPFSSVVAAETRASSQGGVDACPTSAVRPPRSCPVHCWPATSFSVLSLLAVVTLIPLAAVLAGRFLIRQAA